MTRTEMTLHRTALRRLLEPLERVVMCCNECVHFEGNWCCKHEGEPPADVVNTDIGCESWEHDPIPF